MSASTAIVIVGLHSSGKTTLARRISHESGRMVLEMGDVVRAEAARRHARNLVELAHSLLEAGPRFIVERTLEKAADAGNRGLIKGLPLKLGCEDVGFVHLYWASNGRCERGVQELRVTVAGEDLSYVEGCFQLGGSFARPSSTPTWSRACRCRPRPKSGSRWGGPPDITRPSPTSVPQRCARSGRGRGSDEEVGCSDSGLNGISDQS